MWMVKSNEKGGTRTYLSREIAGTILKCQCPRKRMGCGNIYGCSDRHVAESPPMRECVRGIYGWRESRRFDKFGEMTGV